MQQPASLTITSFSDTQIQAVIPGAFLANPDTATISVLNPGNGRCTQSSCLPLVGGGPSQQTFCFAIGGGTRQLGPHTARVLERPARTPSRRYCASAAGANRHLP